MIHLLKDETKIFLVYDLLSEFGGPISAPRVEEQPFYITPGIKKAKNERKEKK